MIGLQPHSEIQRIIENRDLSCERVRHAWLLAKIAEMKISHSRLVAEAEDRTADTGLSWSQLVFTDMFGPDIGILSNIAMRLCRIEKNLRRFREEIQRLENLFGNSPIRG